MSSLARAIEINAISKAYRIGRLETRADTLTSAVLSGLAKPVKNLLELYRLGNFADVLEKKNESNKEKAGNQSSVLWALRNVSFEVRFGDVLGIIGGNGAGKSTLLKILARITEPTLGQAKVMGRMGSLIEVGTGFHPDLTGRENVYLNGTILGMKKREIRQQFSDIVDFSGVGKMIDTPVKRYSSGMRLRLGFAVAAFLETEVLVVDEILAVGDAGFQERCTKRMAELASCGRAVLFVSHNLGAVQNLCNRAILLENGELKFAGRVNEAINRYLGSSSEIALTKVVNGVSSKRININRFRVYQTESKCNSYLDKSKETIVEIAYEVVMPTDNLLLGFDVRTSDGVTLWRTYDMILVGLGVRMPGSYLSAFRISPNVFWDSTYFFELIVGVHRQGWISKDKVRIRISFEGARFTDVDFSGVVQAPGAWSIQHSADSA